MPSEAENWRRRWLQQSLADFVRRVAPKLERHPGRFLLAANPPSYDPLVDFLDFLKEVADNSELQRLWKEANKKPRGRPRRTDIPSPEVCDDFWLWGTGEFLYETKKQSGKSYSQLARDYLPDEYKQDRSKAARHVAALISAHKKRLRG
jgi:hypothetical protein